MSLNRMAHGGFGTTGVSGPGRSGNARTGGSPVVKAVREALAKLPALEREIIYRFYFDGESFYMIAKALGRRTGRIRELHRRALIKLRKYLSAFVRENYGLKIRTGRACPLCQSPFKNAIDHLIREKKKDETWRGIIRDLLKIYGIKIKSPATLIRHRKYHMT
jgi:IS30 family transposase